MLKRNDENNTPRPAPFHEAVGWPWLLTAVSALATILLDLLGWITPVTAMAIFAVITVIALAIAATTNIGSSPKTGDARERANSIRGAGIATETVLLRAALDGVPEILLILDADAMIVYANAAAREFSGKPIEGLPLEYVSRQPELTEAVSAASATGASKTVQIVDRSGAPRHLEATISPLNTGAIEADDAVLILIFDRTAQQRLIDMRADFIANASHELRTPLAAVRGFIETLQGPARRDEAARDRFLNIMSEQAMRMTRLIDDLLLLSRVEDRANLAPSGKVELNETLAHVIEVLRPLADAKSAKLEFIKLSTRAVVAGDRDELVQVFVNLIENAIKYGHQGGIIKIVLLNVRASDGQSDAFLVSVADSGPGIASDHLPRLTERFYRVSPTLSREIGGTGLGLAIVKHVLNRHHGKLDIQSKVGSGSTFSVTLNAQKI